MRERANSPGGKFSAGIDGGYCQVECCSPRHKKATAG